jgi:hypothetical protein
MDWLAELLKHLSISRAFVVALFVTSFAMFVGGKYAPTVVPPVPADWTPVLFGSMVFSGCLSFFWGVAEVWRLATGATQKAFKTLNGIALSAQEMEVLLAMGEKPNKHIDLEQIDYRNAPFTHLEFSALMRSLQTKGLVHINEWNGESAILTEPGRERALKLHRENAQKNAA